MVSVVGVDRSKIKCISCWNCASVLEYTEKDTYVHKHSYDYLGDYETGKAIKCVCCNKDILVK